MSHEQLSQSENNLNTSMGKAFLCERVVMRGKDLHHDLAATGWFNLYMYAITGREFNENELKLLEYIWCATSYPDPSIWPNHVSALAGSCRSTPSLGLMAGLAISEASVWGRRPDKRALDYFLRAKDHLEKGESLESLIEDELSTYRAIYGYGRPLVKIDERIPHMLNFVRKLNLHKGPHLQIALDTHRYLKKTRKLSMNIAAVCSALGADLGLTATEYHLYTTPTFLAGMIPCFIDALDKPEGTFFPMRCNSIKNTNFKKKSWDS